MASIGTFPFGEQVQNIIQTDRTPKRVFILGVYASAVHAHWIGENQKSVVTALAVASEPYIFWRGENAESIISHIRIPRQLGSLVPAQRQFNGPSGIALDDLILKPLALTRPDAWLCDLVPHSCMNSSQYEAIKRAYLPIAQEFDLPLPTVPPVPKVLTNKERRESILSEIHESRANILVLLGDKPIQWFLSHFDPRWHSLKDFGGTNLSYGQLHLAKIGSKTFQILPLAHPRQIAKLGQSSHYWHQEHSTWIENTACRVSKLF